MNLTEVNIRPHLVPFLFKEFEGKEASYMETKSKSVKIYPFSSIGKYLYTQLKNHIKIGKKDQYVLYMMIEKNKNISYSGKLYISINSIYELLKVPEENEKNINNFFEDIFRISFIYWIEGCLEHNKQYNLVSAIDAFIDKYELLEAGFSNETLRRLYYREKTKDTRLSRLQNQSATRVLNFKSVSHK